MSLCPDCITGVRHEGTPTGRIEKIGGVDVYVAVPTGEYAKDKAVLYLPDAMGIPAWNAQLLADDFATNGLQAGALYFVDSASPIDVWNIFNVKVFVIDLFNGDPIPESVIENNNIRASFDLSAWVGKHNESATRPSLDAAISGLRERGIKEFAAIGYCFGGKYVFNLAQDNIIKVGAVSHPSLLQIPADLEKLFAESKAPILINSCDIDQQFPKEACEIADKLFGDGKYAPGYKRVHWEGCVHGFAVRGDLSDPKVKAGKEGSFKETAAWLKIHL